MKILEKLLICFMCIQMILNSKIVVTQILNTTVKYMIDVAKKIYECKFNSAFKYVETSNLSDEIKKIVRDAKNKIYLDDDITFTSDVIISKMGYFYDYSDDKIKKVLL